MTKVTGRIEKIKPVERVKNKAGDQEWDKQIFVIKTDEQYNNIYPLEVFGDEKVANLTKYNKEGDTVTVSYNVKAKEWNDKYIITLSAWRIEQVNGTPNEIPTSNETPPTLTDNDNDELPF